VKLALRCDADAMLMKVAADNTPRDTEEAIASSSSNLPVSIQVNHSRFLAKPAPDAVWVNVQHLRDLFHG
jgi:hypothetical protein